MEDAGDAAGNKRARHEYEFENSEPSDSKRIRADLLFSILDDESEPDNTDLDSVMRSLEEEISLPVSGSDSDGLDASDPDLKQPDLGFLFEASDDELGLPPPEVVEGFVASSEVPGGDGTAAACEVEVAGFEKIWGIDDDYNLDFGFGSEERKDTNGEDDDVSVMFDGGLFEYNDDIRGPTDFSDLTWQAEYLPAA